jgi:hypothetical protein
MAARMRGCSINSLAQYSLSGTLPVIPEYKLYHGAVLSELVDRSESSITIQAYQDSGRLLNYVISGAVGLQIRHATQRLRPWQFTFTAANLDALFDLNNKWELAFLALVCNTDGIVCVPIGNVLPSLATAIGSQAWLRADRQRGRWYRLYGPAGEFPTKFPSGVHPIIESLGQLTGV